MMSIRTTAAFALGIAAPNLAIFVLWGRPADAAPPIDSIPPIDPCILQPAGCFDLPIPNLCEINPSLCPEPEPPRPDLVVTRIDIHYSSNSCEVLIEVENVGDLHAGPFDVDLFYEDEVPVIGDLSNHWRSVAGLAARETATVLFPIPTAQYGDTRPLGVLVDSTQGVEESIEGNNHGFRCAFGLYCLF